MIAKDTFYKLLDRRFQDYARAIAKPGDANLTLHMLSKAVSTMNQIKNLDHKFDLFGSEHWGHGVNFIHDGKQQFKNMDVAVIQKIPELNKHHKYSEFYFLIFKTSQTHFIYHTFCVDVCSGQFNSDIDKKLSLSQLNDVSLKKRDQYYYLDLYFTELINPFTFQVDTYTYGPSMDDLSSVYKRHFEKLIKQNHTPENKRIPDATDVLTMLKNGEDKKTEFKSSVRWDIKENKIGKHIELSVGKTIAAFLNSEGGTILIGIEDDGKVIGLEHDFNSFKGLNKKDEFSKYFDNLLQNYLGKGVARLFSFMFLEIESKIIAVINIPIKAPNPVFLNEGDKSKDEIFFIRRLASTIKLSIRESTEYIRDHWEKE